MKKVLVVGSGGREHALAWKLAESPQVEVVFVAPGNGGTNGGKLESVPISVSDHEQLIAFAKEKEIDLTVIGPDDALASGIVDNFVDAGLTVFGPTQKAAQIESSKAFAKELMKESGVKTASYRTFVEIEEAKRYVSSQTLPLVVKTSGLALGKGVYICQTITEAESALVEIMTDKKFGDSGNEVVIEEFLSGTELSTHVFCDGKTAIMFPSAQDYKAAYDGGKGPNTGGMGVVAPLPWADSSLIEEVKKQIVDPTLSALDAGGSPFTGLLYPGLMETKNGIKVIEFNARFGDPETQCYMRLLESDLYDVLHACARGVLAQCEVKWSNKYVACVVLASKGYPGAYEKGKKITGIKNAEEMEGVVVFHAGTKMDGKNLFTNGGRVLGVTAMADTLEIAIKKAYEAVEEIYFAGKYFRTDIGQATLKKSKPQ